MADFSKLIQITADASKAVREFTKVQKATKDQTQALVQMDRQQDIAFTNMERASGVSAGFRQNLRFAALQAGDFANQISVGGDAVRAFGLQFGNAIGLFGVFGAIAGAAITAGSSLIANWRDMAKEGEELSAVQQQVLDSVRAVSDFMSTFVGNIVDATQAVVELVDQTIGLNTAMYALATVTLVLLRRQLVAFYRLILKNPIVAAIVAAITVIGLFFDKTEELTRVWAAATEFIGDAWIALTANVRAAWDSMIAGLISSLSSGLSTVGQMFIDFRNQIASSINSLTPRWVADIPIITEQFRVFGEAADAANQQAAESAAAAANANELFRLSFENLKNVSAELWNSFRSGKISLDDLNAALAGGGGATEAIKETEDAMKSLAETAASDINNVLLGSIDGFLGMVEKGKIEFEEFAKQIVRDIARIIAKMAILRALGLAFPGLNAGGFLVGGLGGASASALPGAAAAGLGAAGLGGVGATAGNGSLGGGGAGPVNSTGNNQLVNVNVINEVPGAVVEQRVVSDNEVNMIVKMAVNASRHEFSRQIQTGSGEYSRSFEQGYTARRRVT